ncbi:hypothetical protein DIPPA_25993 [Diplonema papillatum]|nr:hypothetical protein DIPPA_25993 [Diplonema papillatum]
MIHVVPTVKGAPKSVDSALQLGGRYFSQTQGGESLSVVGTRRRRAIRSRAGGMPAEGLDLGELAVKRASLSEGDVLAAERLSRAFLTVDADDSGLLAFKELIKYSRSRTSCSGTWSATGAIS